MVASSSAPLPSRPGPDVAIREAYFCAWVAQARPGERLVYHRGHLGIDRAMGMSRLSDGDRRDLGRIADRVLAFTEEGRLLAVQGRHGGDDSSYVAVVVRQGRGR